MGLPGGMTTLMFAMMMASTEIVSMLLQYGANVDTFDVMGNNAFMLASITGRSENIKCWLERVKDWDINRVGKLFGTSMLSKAVYLGANNLEETVKVLLDAGASLD